MTTTAPASTPVLTKTNQPRFNAARLSASDELYWYNNNTNWSALSRKEFREIMIRMETITMQFYDDFGTSHCTYPRRSAAIKKFWAEEWDCEYSPETGEWWDLDSNTVIKSETEKKANRDAVKTAKAEKKAAKADKKEKKEKKEKQQQIAQCNDEEEELYKQALAQQQQQQQQSYDEWFDAEEEAYAEAYAKAREADELKQQQEAQAYLEKKKKEEEEEEKEKEPKPRVACQPVLYFEELTDVEGDPDWRAYIYYDARIRRYIFKGTRRSLRSTSKKTSYPEVKLCFRSSRELASFLCSSTNELINATMFAMASATVKDATFAELYALPARGCKTELFGYDCKYMRYSTFVDYLCMLRDMDASHSCI